MPRIRTQDIESHKELTRRELLDAAQDLFRTIGFEATTFGDIAAAVGIGRTTVYKYFKDMDDIAAAVVEETMPDVIASILEEIPATMPPRERLSILAARMVEYAVTGPTIGYLIHGATPKLSLDSQERSRRAHHELVAAVGQIYMNGVAAGDFRKMAPDLAGRFIQDTIMSASRMLMNHADPTARLEEVTSGMVDFLLNGLSTR